MSYSEAMAEHARLYLLRELDAQTDGHLNEILLQRLLGSRYGVNRSREYVRTQLRKLEELGAVELKQAGELVIAHIQRPGRDHLQERSVLEGVTRPVEIE